jgi:DNA-binding transcriptional LysR family regulator
VHCQADLFTSLFCEKVASSRQICAAVEAGEVDVAIVGGGVPEAMRRLLAATPYATDELVLIVPS